MHLGEIDVAYLVGAVVDDDLASSPIEALDAEFVTWLEHLDKPNVGTPAIHRLDVGRLGWSRQINLLFWACNPPGYVLASLNRSAARKGRRMGRLLLLAA